MISSRFVLFSLPILTVFALILAACGAGGAAAPSQGQASQTQEVPVEGGGRYIDINAAGLAAMLKDKDFLLVNVHVPYAGEIEGTDLLIPFDQIEQNLDRLPAEKDAKIVVYCRSGGMSAIAARTLVKLGYTNVWNLDGGMIGWEQAGYSLVSKSR